LRQEIFEVTAAIGSAGIPAGADIGTLLFFFFIPAFPCGRKRVVNGSTPQRRLF
jgi:hypothetical protein